MELTLDPGRKPIDRGSAPEKEEQIQVGLGWCGRAPEAAAGTQGDLGGDCMLGAEGVVWGLPGGAPSC